MFFKLCLTIPSMKQSFSCRHYQVELGSNEKIKPDKFLKPVRFERIHNLILNYFTSSVNTVGFPFVEKIGAETVPPPPPAPVVQVKVVLPVPALSTGAAAVPVTVPPVQVMVLPVIAEIVNF